MNENQLSLSELSIFFFTTTGAFAKEVFFTRCNECGMYTIPEKAFICDHCFKDRYHIPDPDKHSYGDTRRVKLTHCFVCNMELSPYMDQKTEVFMHPKIFCDETCKMMALRYPKVFHRE